MLAYILRRLIGALYVLIGVAAIVFIIVHLTGDPAAVMMPPESTAADLADFRHLHGFDRPLIVQFGSFALGVLRGDFGDSLRHGEPALGLALGRLPASGELALTALALAVVVAVPAGIMAALKRNTALDVIARTFALIGQSTPVYWLGIMLILVFAVQLEWLPTGGIGGGNHFILPALTLGLFTTAKIMRLTRAALLDILQSDYLRTARAKGVQPVALIVNHALRNAWLPIVTVIGVELGTLFSQAIITETIFAWPGIGRLAVQAIYDRDYPVVEVVVLIAATVFVIVNLLVDLSYALLDPRIRYE
jgi:peptide/nickel transport system permease protein